MILLPDRFAETPAPSSPIQICFILSLPSELLSDIFLHTAQSFGDEFDTINRCLIPSLSRTCHRFRATACATPHLWSFISFQFNHNWLSLEIATQTAENLFNHREITTRLERSRTVPIHIQVHFVTEDARYHLKQSSIELFKEMLLPHLPRCLTFALINHNPHHSPHTPRLFPLSWKMPILREIDYDTPRSRIADVTFLDTFSAPHLRTIQCRSAFLFREGRDVLWPETLPFPQLTSLEFISHELPRVSGMQNLTHLRILAFPSVPRMKSFEDSRSTIELPSLRVFSIYIRTAALQGNMTLNAPALTHLQLEGWRGSFDPSLPPLIAQSIFPGLVTFEVYSSYVWLGDTSDIVAWVVLHSNLRRVLLPLPDTPIQPYNRFIDSLTSENPSLPRLELIQLYRSPQSHLTSRDLVFFHPLVAALSCRQNLRVECMNAGHPTEDHRLAVKPLRNRWRWVYYDDVFDGFFRESEYLRDERVLLNSSHHWDSG